MRIATALASLLLLSAPSWAQFNIGISPTEGSNGYQALSIYGGIGFMDNYSLTPEYDQFTANNIGTYRTASARLGYDQSFWGVGVTGGGTFKEDGYSDVFAGADVAISITPSGKSVGVHRIGGGGRSAAPSGEGGLARIDLGAGVLVTDHMLDAVPGHGSASVDQADLDAYAGVSLMSAEIAARVTQSAYSHDLKTTYVPPPIREPIDGLLGYINYYPETNLHLSLELPGGAFLMPMVTPILGYTETTYEQIGVFTPGNTKAITAGLKVGLQLLEVDGIYQHVIVSGGSDQNYVGVGAGLRI